ncbi:hypothetical protein D3C87_1031850 [compost metagenome]
MIKNKVLQSVLMIIGGWLSIGLAYSTNLGYSIINTFCFLGGIVLFFIGIIMFIIAVRD